MRNADEVFDEWLVLKCQGGDASALAILVERWQPRLLGFAIRLLGDQDLADDAVQSAWLVVVKRIRSLRDPRAIRPWLFRIVANRCADVIRRRTKRREKESAEETDQVADPQEEQQRVEEKRTERITSLRRVMRSLDSDHRDVLRMHYSQDLSIEAMSRRLRIPVGTVKSRLFHARKKLKEALEGEKDE